MNVPYTSEPIRELRVSVAETTKGRSMTDPSRRLRVVVATPLAEENCALIERLEPRIDSDPRPVPVSADATCRRLLRRSLVSPDPESAAGLRGHGRLGRGALRHSRCRPGRSEADSGRESGAALGSHHGGRRRRTGEGRRTERGPAEPDPLHDLGGGARRPVGRVRGLRGLCRREGSGAAARPAARPDLERSLGDAPGLGDDRAGRRARRHRSGSGEEAGRVSGPR